MLNKFLVLTILAIIYSASGYAQTRKTLDSWLGHTRKELLQQWGLPDREGSDGDGGYILAYRTRDMKGDKWTSFYVDNENIIRSWTTKPIPPQIIKVQPANGWNFDSDTYTTPRN